MPASLRGREYRGPDCVSRGELAIRCTRARGDVFSWQLQMAAAAIPVALLYTLFLDKSVAGFPLGAVKG
jgi:hypothetical protein